MSATTRTYEATYTVADIKKVVDRFAADFYMIGTATGLRTRESVAKAVADVKVYAEAEYLQGIDVTLFDADGNELNAVQYKVSNKAVGWTNQQPGNNLWPYTPAGTLKVTLTLSSEWWGLSATARSNFNQRHGLNWPEGNPDLSHPTLPRQFDRHYVSNGWGMEKDIFGRL